MRRDARAVAAGAGVVIAAWLAVRGVPGALGELRREEELLAQRAELLARARARVASLAGLDDSIRAADRVAAALPRMILAGEDPATASVDLMRRIREALGPLRLKLIGFEPLRADRQSGPLTMVAITAKIETDYFELLTALDVIGDDPALAIEALEVRAADPHADSTVAERLTADIGVTGWYRPAPEDTMAPPAPPPGEAR